MKKINSELISHFRENKKSNLAEQKISKAYSTCENSPAQKIAELNKKNNTITQSILAMLERKLKISQYEDIQFKFSPKRDQQIIKNKGYRGMNNVMHEVKIHSNPHNNFKIKVQDKKIMTQSRNANRSIMSLINFDRQKLKQQRHGIEVLKRFTDNGSQMRKSWSELRMFKQQQNPYQKKVIKTNNKIKLIFKTKKKMNSNSEVMNTNQKAFKSTPRMESVEMAKLDDKIRNQQLNHTQLLPLVHKKIIVDKTYNPEERPQYNYSELKNCPHIIEDQQNIFKKRKLSMVSQSMNKDTSNKNTAHKDQIIRQKEQIANIRGWNQVQSERLNSEQMYEQFDQFIQNQKNQLNYQDHPLL